MEFVKVIEKGVESTCEVARAFDDVRVIVKYEGAYIFADRISPTEWELSDIPARPGAELQTLNSLVETIEVEGTTVTIAKE